uniref:Ig-like domain-containing protein n=1 Tax=Periophthalmus magnuspinnatus TaxID=409849 RepID=A0A3B4ABQ4_9GOBI
LAKGRSATVWKQGASARLQCSVKGSPELKVLWFCNDSELRPSNRISMSLKEGVATLEIQQVALSDSGTYSCEVQNDSGSELCSTKVTVKETCAKQRETCAKQRETCAKQRETCAKQRDMCKTERDMCKTERDVCKTGKHVQNRERHVQNRERCAKQRAQKMNECKRESCAAEVNKRLKAQT